MVSIIKPKTTIVDNNDKIIGFKDRNSLDKKDIYRVSALWITNSHGEILLAKRHRNKIHHPEKWGPAVAGTIEKGETYKSNIIKESEEELGLKNINPSIGPKTETNDEYHHFTQWYVLTIDKNIDEFKIQEDEVEEVKWFTPEELKLKLTTNPENFLPNLSKYFDLFSQSIGQIDGLQPRPFRGLQLRSHK